MTGLIGHVPAWWMVDKYNTSITYSACTCTSRSCDMIGECIVWTSGSACNHIAACLVRVMLPMTTIQDANTCKSQSFQTGSVSRARQIRCTSVPEPRVCPVISFCRKARTAKKPMHHGKERPKYQDKWLSEARAPSGCSFPKSLPEVWYGDPPDSQSNRSGYIGGDQHRHVDLLS